MIKPPSFHTREEGTMTAPTKTSLLVATGVAALTLVSYSATGSANGTQATGAPATAAPAKAAPAASPASDAVASAESAAPASVAHGATIVTVGSDGKMSVVRKGTNGWTCMPDAPDTPGPDPMCFDANSAKWVDAWVHHKAPPAGAVGLMYMLEGGTDASNTDPYATKPTAKNDWISTGPHVMIVGSKDILAGYPAGAKPDPSAPYVMWAGTPYAHLMVPVKQADSAAPATAAQ
jgi:hypothetical protein